MTNQQLYAKAKRLIPGGTQLLSKRPEMYAPNVWPAYYRSAKGCRIIDFDGREFSDFSTSGIGSCLLGYSCDAVDDAVIKAIRNGSMSTLNPPAEVELAERLLQLDSWAEAVRFTRTGGEAMSVAVRVARAATKRSKVAICGYHGWHDWYLSANLHENQALDGQLLPGLQPRGVPKQLTSTAFTFRFNHINDLEDILKGHGQDIGAIIMEPMRMIPPQDGFLEKVRELADRHGAVLIFDEITSGWRYQLGGVHKLWAVNPDMTVYAKAISNGFPMAAIVGRKQVMESAQVSFISSTYWTEAIGPAAALASISEMAGQNIWPILRNAVASAHTSLTKHALKSRLPIKCLVTDAMVTFQFMLGEESNIAKTLFTTLMLNHGIMASNAFYATSAHTASELRIFDEAVSVVFKKLGELIDAGVLRSALTTPEAHDGFRRLT